MRLPPIALRSPLLGCALAVVAALLLSACGDGGAATAEKPPAKQAQRKPEPEPGSGRPCPAKVTSFASSLQQLRRQLEVGLSYEQYAARIKALRASYDEIPTGRLALDCLSATATPAERALNRYIDAANAWGECLADASCTTAMIEPVLQRKWRLASGSLPEAP